MLRSILVALLMMMAAGAKLFAAENVDESPLPVKMVDAFPKLRFVRPLVLTHAGDGTNRVFVVSQLGTVHVFPNDQAATKSKLFLDITKKVVYKEKENEEGFLGLAFHPRYKENGYFFVYYSTTESPHTTVVSRFRVSSNNPDQADTSSEEELLRVPHPYWNHKGGTICFGPDGHLYIAIGDGGSANDPHRNGQNLKTLLAKILRIDVDRQRRRQAIRHPQGQSFRGRRDKALPEIYASGMRNVWRMSFDRQTGLLWAADVGQDLWEEINLIVPGGNYGWNLREGLHVFVPKKERPIRRRRRSKG